jgi:peptidyl-prolyl cis-trans isomerase C
MAMKLGWIAGTLLGATLGLGTVASAQNLAVVNGKAVPSTRVDAFVAQVQKAGRPVDEGVRAQIREEVINREVFMQEAQRLGLDAGDDYRTQLELNRQAILIRSLFEDFAKKNPVTDAEAKAEYDKVVGVRGGKEYRARHILVEKEDEAKAIIASLKRGGKFEDIAKKQSKDPGSGANGGDLDWANPGSYVKEFSDALVKLTKGQITEAPVKSQFGFHIIRLEDTRDAQLPPFEQVKAQVVQQLSQQKLQKFQADLRQKAKVE